MLTGQVQKVFEFAIKEGSETKNYVIDLKDGTAGPSEQNAKKPDVTLSMDDKVFQQLFEGKANAQSLFMKGQIKIKGNMMASTKLGPVLAKLRETSPKAKL